MDSTQFEQIWSAVYGRPAWLVKKGHGSFLTFEFGEPALRIREPRPPLDDVCERVRERLSQRQVTVYGAWRLWIYCCHWSIAQSGKELAHSESPDDEIVLSTQRLDGQKLLSVAPGTAPGSWVFSFDLGGELKTWPYDDDPSYVQWHLFERASSRVLSARADGHCTYGSDAEPA